MGNIGFTGRLLSKRLDENTIRKGGLLSKRLDENTIRKGGLQQIDISILNCKIDDDEFHAFAFFKYGLLIDYDNNTDELVVNELDGVKSGR